MNKEANMFQEMQKLVAAMLTEKEFADVSVTAHGIEFTHREARVFVQVKRITFDPQIDVPK